MGAPSQAVTDPLWSHPETAAHLKISESTLHQMNYKGTGPRSYRVGKYRRYDPRDVQAWLQAHASDSPKPTA